MKERNWTVLFIGGASGTGKSCLAHALAKFYNTNVIEADDVYQVVKAVTTRECFPAVHHWSTGIGWMDIGVRGNVEWLINVSKEMIPALKSLADRYIEDDLPVIIEGDFVCPEFTVAFNNPKIKSLYVLESDKEQLLCNYLAREGGELQHYRAEISAAYGKQLMDACETLGIPVIEARPWETIVDRASDALLQKKPK